MENSVSNPLAWMFFADKDISIAELAVDNEELSGEVVFHCQQAVEKYMKAFLAKSKTPFKKTHDLVELYLKVKDIKDWDIDRTKLEHLNDLYIETRYPSNIGFFPDHSLPTVEEAKSYLDFAKNIANIVKAECAA
ncbi:MAG: HEPN domain-containing protein [Fibromonadaceae bacterium]|jgi:HEPN domain-containing protein|nr:HEPN domain-containing protein [Fibromonadaceae bacterium]